MQRQAILTGTLALAMLSACAPPAGQVLDTATPAGQAAPTEVTAPVDIAPAETATLQPAGTATQAPARTTVAATMTPAADLPPELVGLPQVEQARTDLAARLTVAPTDIDVLSVEMRTWSDASMGCPQPGMAYLQVPQDGLLVMLSHAGIPYAYHSGGATAPFLCEPNLAGDKSTPIFGEDILTQKAP